MEPQKSRFWYFVHLSIHLFFAGFIAFCLQHKEAENALVHLQEYHRSDGMSL